MTAGASDAAFLGLRLYEWLTLVGIIIGPIVAVVITLWAQARRNQRDQRIQILRMLLNSRHIPADPAWSTAVNLIPVEFHSKSEIMSAWKEYLAQAYNHPTPENMQRHDAVVRACQSKLIYLIMKSLGFDLSEGDIQTSAYVSKGFVDRDNIYIDSLVANREIAEALKLQCQIIGAGVQGGTRLEG